MVAPGLRCDRSGRRLVVGVVAAVGGPRCGRLACRWVLHRLVVAVAVDGLRCDHLACHLVVVQLDVGAGCRLCGLQAVVAVVYLVLVVHPTNAFVKCNRFNRTTN